MNSKRGLRVVDKERALAQELQKDCRDRSEGCFELLLKQQESDSLLAIDSEQRLTAARAVELLSS